MQTINLNLIPRGIPDVVNASQYDVGRSIQFALYDGVNPYNVSQDATVQVAGKKGDNHIFCYDQTDGVVSWSGNVVTITSTQQMTAYAGEVLAQLRVIDSGDTLATVNFKMLIQPRPDAEGDISETEIPALIALAEEQELDAEAWAKGTKNGVPVTSYDEQYNDHAKYWAGQAREAAVGAIHYKGTTLFAYIPTSGMVNGDLYNILDDFTTDNRFEEGSGVYCAAGTNIIWDALNSLWDIAGGLGGVTSFNGRHGAITPTAGDYSAEKISASMTIGGVPYTDVRGCLNALQAEIPAAQVQSDYTQTDTTKKDYIKNKPTLGTAAAKNVPASGDAATTEVVMGDDTRLTNARNAADVYSWAKAENKPTYTASEVGALSSSTNYAGSASRGGPANSVQNSLSINDGSGTLITYNGHVAKTIAKVNMLKRVYSIDWTSTVDADGYYTNTINLSQWINTYVPIFISCCGVDKNTLPTAEQKAAFNLCDVFYFADGQKVGEMTIKAKTKPTVDFYILISGEYYA